MKQLFSLLLFCMLSNLTAQTLDEYNALAQQKDSVGQQALLKKWEKTGANDPDYYIALFNYHAAGAKKEVLSIQSQPGEDESFALKDSTNATAGYMTSRIIYDGPEVDKAVAAISKGIAKFPNRLDMRFGKIYLLGEDGNYDAFTNEVITTVDYSNKIKNKWLWSGGKPQEDAVDFMLSTVQKYVYQLYETGNDNLLPNMQRISQSVLKYYPNHIESLSSVGVVYMLQNQPVKALESLLKAHKVQPTDTIVLGNIAHAYKLNNDKPNAIKYYELLKKHGNADEQANAESQILKLKI